MFSGTQNWSSFPGEGALLLVTPRLHRNEGTPPTAGPLESWSLGDTEPRLLPQLSPIEDEEFRLASPSAASTGESSDSTTIRQGSLTPARHPGRDWAQGAAGESVRRREAQSLEKKECGGCFLGDLFPLGISMGGLRMP